MCEGGRERREKEGEGRGGRRRGEEGGGESREGEEGVYYKRGHMLHSCMVLYLCSPFGDVHQLCLDLRLDLSWQRGACQIGQIHL